MDSDELVSILKQKFQGVDREVIRAVLEDNDNRLAAAEEALRSVASRQGGSGTGPSGRPVRLCFSAEISAWRRAFLGHAATLVPTQLGQHGNHAPKRLSERSHPRGSVRTGVDQNIRCFSTPLRVFRSPYAPTDVRAAQALCRECMRTTIMWLVSVQLITPTPLCYRSPGCGMLQHVARV